MDDLFKTELLDSLAMAYQLPGESRKIKDFPHHDYVYKLTVGNRHYIAKIGNCWSGADIRFKIGLQQYLHENGYPIPHIHTTGNGDAIWDVDGVGAILTDFIGSAYDPSRKREQCDAAATTMGWFHRETNKPLDIGTCYWDVDARFEYSQAFNDNARGFLASKPLSASSRQHVTDGIDEMAELLRKATSLLISKQWYQLPHVPVHGEYCQYHCRYDKDEVVGVIDWDTARLAPRIQDVARAIDVGLGWGASVKDYDSFQWRWADIPDVGDVVHWIDCYREKGPSFSELELELLPYTCAAMWPTAGGSQVPNSEEEVRECERVVDFMRFWLDEASLIQEALM